MAWYRQLHWQILIGMALGALFGIVAAQQGWGGFTSDWIAPIGKIFVNLLKLIAVPLVLTSLVCGVASLSDFKKLSRMGGKTIALYLATTAVAVTIGLLMVNAIKPGAKMSDEQKAKLQEQGKKEAGDVNFSSDKMGTDKLKENVKNANKAKESGPLAPLINMVPDNFMSSASDNKKMLQVVFVSLLIGIALVQVPADKRKPVFALFQGLQEVVIKIVFIIMLIAPAAVFALIADTITIMAKDDPSNIFNLFKTLGWYCLCVVASLLVHLCVVYLGLLKILTPMSLKQFFNGMGPAQLLAFSSSSSGATLPVTMKRCEEKLGISKETSSFVLPLGATINMDGTALYQAIATVFIGQVMLDVPFSFATQVNIVLLTVLASIGTAAVPGAGMVMLIVILEGVWPAEAAVSPVPAFLLILSVDRILDMCRTAVNVTGDATVATIIAHSEKQLHLDKPAD